MGSIRTTGGAGALPLLLLALLPNAGCGTDNTCFPGQAMTNPRILGKAQPSLAGSRIRIGWDVGAERGAELPRTYFTAGRVDTSKRNVGPDGPSMEERVESDAEREIAVTVRGTLAELQGKLRFDIVFPDRKQFLTCERADGVVDRYGLSVDAELDSQGNVTKASITEIRTTTE
ncbi:MAG: hypothetical protein JST00_28530 [Deltaproteobacteria bacterium]|nr:hypothetical protein [Deltaproteobacteria bacterium]